MDRPRQQPHLLPILTDPTGNGQRILASLEHGMPMGPTAPRAGSRQLDSWIIGIGTLVIALAVFAWSVRDHAIRAPRQPHSIASALRQAPPTSAEDGPAVAEQQAAAIINETKPPSQPPPLPLPAAAPVPVASSSPAPLPSSAMKTHSPARRSSSTPGRPAPADQAQLLADTDVTLLTALVTHAGQPAVVTPERSQDVVVRRDSDSTAALLTRCTQLGLMEGMLCRARICAGRWDSDAACRAPHH